MTPVEAQPRVDALAAQLTREGSLTSDWWGAFWRVPRHAFIPDRVWRDEGARLVPLIRAEDPEGWWAEVYANDAVITQADDGLEPVQGAVGEHPSSSATMPSIVLRMLNELDVRDGHRVLEIGTGTGYNAALLSARLGENNVTTVEVDAEVAKQATAALQAAGWQPTVVIGDGAEGYPPNAPYDRLIATCAVEWVPYTWVEQSQSGGIIVTPWSTSLCNNALARLITRRDGTASGHFVDAVAFMRLRSQRPLRGDVDRYVGHEDQAQRGSTNMDLWDMFNDEHSEFAIGAQVPGCQYTVILDDDTNEFTIWFVDGHSWASVDAEPTADSYPVHQYGPRRLWDEVEAAYHRWIAWGRPERERFGLTVTPDAQWVWLDEPSRTVTAARS